MILKIKIRSLRTYSESARLQIGARNDSVCTERLKMVGRLLQNWKLWLSWMKCTKVIMCSIVDAHVRFGYRQRCPCAVSILYRCFRLLLSLCRAGDMPKNSIYAKPDKADKYSLMARSTMVDSSSSQSTPTISRISYVTVSNPIFNFEHCISRRAKISQRLLLAGRPGFQRSS